jgi:hypothetical protein
MSVDGGLILIVMCFGLAAFFFGMLWLVVRLFAGVFRGGAALVRSGTSMITGRPKRGHGLALGPAGRGGGVQCPRPNCGHLEMRAARFCSRCGGQLK